MVVSFIFIFLNSFLFILFISFSPTSPSPSPFSSSYFLIFFLVFFFFPLSFPLTSSSFHRILSCLEFSVGGFEMQGEGDKVAICECERGT